MNETIATTGTVAPEIEPIATHPIVEPTTVVSTGTLSQETLEGKIEGVANLIGDVAASSGLPEGTVADAALHGLENVVGTVQTDLANHANDLTTAVDGLVAVANNSTTVAAKVSPAAASKVQTIEQKIAAFAADIGADIAGLFEHIKL